MVLVVLGAAMAASGVGFFLRGTAGIPDKGVVGNTLDGEFRFHAALFLAYGAAAAWCAKDVEGKRRLVDLVALVCFLGGAGRLAAALSVGAPVPEYRGYIAGELLLPVVIAFLNDRVARRADPPKA